jgi:hypothetical protein
MGGSDQEHGAHRSRRNAMQDVPQSSAAPRSHQMQKRSSTSPLGLPLLALGVVFARPATLRGSDGDMELWRRRRDWLVPWPPFAFAVCSELLKSELSRVYFRWVNSDCWRNVGNLASDVPTKITCLAFFSGTRTVPCVATGYDKFI